MLLKKLLSCISLCFLLSTSLFSQDLDYFYPWWDGREITTDYNSCMQGVKDSLGNWVIEPKYDIIEDHYDRYMVYAGGKMGLLDYNGKEMVPLVYDDLSPVDNWYYGTTLPAYYKVTIGDYEGIIDSVNHIIVPIRYTYIRSYNDSTFTCRLSKRTYDFYNINGTCFHVPWKSKTFPVHEARHAVSMSKKNIFGRKYGLLDDSGNVIFKRKYDVIDGFDNTGTLRIEKDSKYGFCSLAGKEIWPMTFTYGRYGWYVGSLYSIVAQNGIGPAFSNGHWGLISITGDTLLPFQYDEILPLRYSGGNSLWKVLVDSLIGVYDPKNGWVLRPESTELITIETYFTSDSTAVALLVAQQNGKWGALTTAGQLVVPFTNEQMLRLDEDRYIFMKGDSLFYLGPRGFWERSALVEEVTGKPSSYWFDDFYFEYELVENRVVPDSKAFSVYYGKNGVRAFYNPSLVLDTVKSGDTLYSLSTGKTYGMRVPDSIIVSAQFYVIPITKSELHTPQFDIFATAALSDTDSSRSYNTYLVTRYGKQPELAHIREKVIQDQGYDYLITSERDLLKTDGTVVYSNDSVWEINDSYHGNDGSLYFTVTKNGNLKTAIDTSGRQLLPHRKDLIGDFSNKYTWYSNDFNGNYWVLKDNRTNEAILGKKVLSDDPFPIWDSITVVRNKQGGMRLFNITRRKYLTDYGFNSVIPLSMKGNLFAVKTCTQHVGVMDASGKFVLDTIYEAFTRLARDTSINESGFVYVDYYSRFYKQLLFYSASSSALLDCSTGLIIPRAQSLTMLWQESTTVIPHDDMETALRDSFYRYTNYNQFLTFYISQKDSATIQSWQKQCVMDSLYSPARDFNRFSNFHYPCEYCRQRKANSVRFDWQKNYNGGASFAIKHHTDSLLSFSRIYRNSSEYESLERTWFTNVMLFPDGAHQMELDSLFNPASDWRNFIINTLITYVNTHMGIDGDCHNPAGIPTMLKQNFLITPEGLLLYPPDFTENGKQLVLTVPWKDIDGYLRNDIRTRLPLGGK